MNLFFPKVNVEKSNLFSLETPDYSPSEPKRMLRSRGGLGQSQVLKGIFMNRGLSMNDLQNR
jgi:hypothetical protein